MKISKEFKVGLMALVSMILLYLGFNFLKGTDFFSSNEAYYATYKNIDGLTVSNPIMINGFQIGRVSSIEMIPEENNLIKITLEINESIKIKKDSKAILKDNGLLGGKMIELKIGTSKEELKGGETLESLTDDGLMAIIQKKAPPIIDKADSVMTELVTLLKSVESVKVSVEATLKTYEATGEALTGTINENRKHISGTLGNLQNLSASLVETEKSFKPVIGKMNSFADSLNALQLKETVNKTNQSIAQLQDVLGKINRGEGSLGALVNDAALYENLNSLSTDLDKLLIDLRKNPKRYVKISVF